MVGARPISTHRALRYGLVDRRGLVHRHALLAVRGHGDLRRAADGGGLVRRAPPHRLSRALSRRRRGRRRTGVRARGARRAARDADGVDRQRILTGSSAHGIPVGPARQRHRRVADRADRERHRYLWLVGARRPARDRARLRVVSTRCPGDCGRPRLRRAGRRGLVLGRRADRERDRSRRPARRFVSASSRATSSRGRSGIPRSPTRSSRAIWICRATPCAAARASWSGPSPRRRSCSRRARRFRTRFARLAIESQTTFLVGSDQVERDTPPRYYNSAFLVQPNGAVGGTYRKMHLVPFGEYVPFKKIFAFASPLVEAAGRFRGGQPYYGVSRSGRDRSAPPSATRSSFPSWRAARCSAAAACCRRSPTTPGTGAARRPGSTSIRRACGAIEQGRFLIRAANTGISGIVDPVRPRASRARRSSSRRS